MRRNLFMRDWRMLLWVAAIWQPMTDLWAKTTRWPLVGKYFGWMLNERHYGVSLIPVNQELEAPEGTVVPKQIVAEMIRRSSHRVIMPVCLCRVGCRCQDHPMEIGCIFLGPSTMDIDPSIAKQVSVEEALRHVERSIAAGLIPQIGRVDPDPFMLGIKARNWDRFLTLCFCCPCCCIAMRNMTSFAPDVQARIRRLDGLRIDVGPECNGCGVCAKACFGKAIRIEDKRARITEMCKGCGICASECPQGAIKISVSDGNRMLDEAFRRIESYANIT